MNLASFGLIAILISCVFLLVSIFLLGPLPYIIAAAVLKIEKRGYWKAFGTAILGSLAGGIIMMLVIWAFAAITGASNAFTLSNLRNSNNLAGLIGLFGGSMILGYLIGLAASILVQMLIAAGLYGVKFGKGALIWLLGLVFSILIGIAIFLLFFILSVAGVLPNLKNLDLKNLLPGYF